MRLILERGEGPEKFDKLSCTSHPLFMREFSTSALFRKSYYTRSLIKTLLIQHPHRHKRQTLYILAYCQNALKDAAFWRAQLRREPCFQQLDILWERAVVR